MDDQLSIEDLDFVIYSLNETKRAFENYDRYPDEKFRKDQVLKVENLLEKIKNLKKK